MGAIIWQKVTTCHTTGGATVMGSFPYPRSGILKLDSAASKEHDGDLVPLIKMIKGWNRTIHDYFRSFHLEVMALQILNRVKDWRLRITVYLWFASLT